MSFKIYKHFSAYSGPWPWQSFRPHEIACRHCGELALDPCESLSPSLDALQLLRDEWKRPIIVNSGHRCAAHNSAVGGEAGSRHLGLAFDCVCPAAEQEEFIRLARKAGFTGIGRYPSRGFVHLDLGPAREWRG